MQIIRKIASFSIRIGISIILLIFLFKFKKIDTQVLWQNLRNVDKPFLFLSFFIFLLIYLFCFLRWLMLLRAAQINPPLKRIVTSFAGGIFFNLFLPSTIGGDFARSLDLSQDTKRPREVVATVFLDRLSGYIGLVIVVLPAFLLGWDFIRKNTPVVLSVATITLILIVVLLVLFNNFLFSRVNKLLDSSSAGRIREALKNLHQEIYYFRKHKKVIANNLIISVIIQGLLPVCSYLLALSLGVKMRLIYFFIFIPIIGAITLLPISIGGLGLRENTTVFFFTQVGMSQNIALLISLFNLFFMLICGAIGGLIYVLTLPHRRLQYHP